MANWSTLTPVGPTAAPSILIGSTTAARAEQHHQYPLITPQAQTTSVTNDSTDPHHGHVLPNGVGDPASCTRTAGCVKPADKPYTGWDLIQLELAEDAWRVERIPTEEIALASRIQDLIGPRAYKQSGANLVCQDCRVDMPAQELPLHSLFCYETAVTCAARLASTDSRSDGFAQRVRVRCHACKKLVRTVLWEEHHERRCLAGLKLGALLRKRQKMGESSDEDSEGEPVHFPGPPSYGKTWPTRADVVAFEGDWFPTSIRIL
jgi:hypothetical protein